MKPRFSSREAVWLLIPSLLLGGGALYLQKSEKFGRRGVYVEHAELMVATPLDMSRGTSHLMKVTLDYAGWNPKWWTSCGDFANIYSSADPSQKDAADWRQRQPDYFAAGSNLMVSGTKVSRSHRMPRLEREGGRYIVTHYLSLASVAVEKGAVTFQSIYRMRDLPPLTWQRVVRQNGEKLIPPVDRNPHASIVSLLPEKGSQNLADFLRGFATAPSSVFPLELTLRHLPRDDGKAATVFWEEAEIFDSQKRVFRQGRDFNLVTRHHRSSITTQL